MAKTKEVKSAGPAAAAKVNADKKSSKKVEAAAPAPAKVSPLHDHRCTGSRLTTAEREEGQEEVKEGQDAHS